MNRSETKDICRICLKTRRDVGLYSIFHHRTKDGQVEDLSLKFIKVCSEIDIHKDDGLPENICQECTELLNKAYTFKILTLQNDKKLRRCFNDRLQIPIKQESEVCKVETISRNENCLSFSYNCSICAKTFSKINLYKKHVQIHSKLIIPSENYVKLGSESFQCDTCSKSFKTKSVLIKHIGLHDPIKRYVCEICGRRFEQRSYLRIHLSTHSGDKKYECSICSFKTAYRNSLMIHMRKHTGQRPFTCDICGYTCVSSSNLYVHQRQHDGVKYDCKLCSKRFGYKTSLNEHIMATHKGLKNYSCSVCDKSYSRRRGLRRHIQLKHQNS